MAKWSPLKVIERTARALQQRAADQIRSSAPPVPHRGSTSEAPGGSLAKLVASPALIAKKPWGVVIRWRGLGQKFLWFTKGTSRQKARPVDLAPDVARLTRDLEADAAAHYGARARERRPA